MAWPGWYPDELDSSIERWWDGDRWTIFTRPTGPSTRPAAASPPPMRLATWYQRRVVWGAAVVIVAVVVGVAFLRGGDNPSGSTLADARSIASTLDAGGWECTGWERTEAGENDMLASSTETSGTCDHDGDEANLYVFPSSDHASQYRRQVSSIGCSMAEAFGVTEVWYAYGANWVVQHDDNLDESGHRRVADILDGNVEHLNC